MKSTTNLDNRAGYVYVASNNLMPGLVKVGRTQGLVPDRVKALYTTGVPEPFNIEGNRFFVDCVAAEIDMHRSLAQAGKRCCNREFFVIEKRRAMTILDDLYKNQHKGKQEDLFEWGVEEVFFTTLSKGDYDWAMQAVNVLGALPRSRRNAVKLRLLAGALERRADSVATWFVRDAGVDPDEPIKDPAVRWDLPLYHLNAFEYSILFGLEKFESYLLRIGCDIGKSNALYYVIDTMINNRRPKYFMEGFVDFAVKLVERGANLNRRLDVGLFAEAPRKPDLSNSFRFDIFPRNSNMPCGDVMARLALDDPWFAKLHEAIAHSK